MDDILYLEPDEEITSIVDKVKASKGNLVGLVVPKGALFVQSVVNLRLVLAEAERHHKKLAIVTADNVGRNLAAQVGIDVYDSVRAEHPTEPPPTPATPTTDEIVELDLSPPQKQAVPKDVQVHSYLDQQAIKRQEMSFGSVRAVREEPSAQLKGTLEEVDEEPARPNRFQTIQTEVRRGQIANMAGKIVGIIALLVGVFLVGFGLTFLRGRAEVTIGVAAAHFSTDVTVTADTSIKSVDAASGIFPGTRLEGSQDGSKTQPATGTKNVGEKAKGTISLLNSWTTDSVSVGAGTKLVAQTKTFVTTGAVVIPGAGVELKNGQINTIPGKTSVDIQADQAGQEYNLGPTKFLFADFSGDKQQKIYGQSTNSLSGGSTKQVTIVSEDDYKNAANALENDLKQALSKELSQKANGRVAPPENFVISDKKFSSSVPVGNEASTFEVKGSLKAAVVAYQQADFEAVVRAQALHGLPPGKGVLPTDKDTLNTTFSQDGSTQDKAILKVHYEGTAVDAVDEAAMLQAISGQTAQHAEELLKQMGAKSAQVFLSPRWIKTVPTKPDRIKLTITPISADGGPQQ